MRALPSSPQPWMQTQYLALPHTVCIPRYHWVYTRTAPASAKPAPAKPAPAKAAPAKAAPAPVKPAPAPAKAAKAGKP